MTENIALIRDLLNHIPQMRLNDHWSGEIVIRSSHQSSDFDSVLSNLLAAHSASTSYFSSPFKLFVHLHLDHVQCHSMLFKTELFEALEHAGFGSREYSVGAGNNNSYFPRILDDGTYLRCREFNRENEKVLILFDSKELDKIRVYNRQPVEVDHCQLNLFDPSPSLVTLIHNICSPTPITLSTAEFAFDFYCDDFNYLIAVGLVLQHFVYLRHNKLGCFFIDEKRRKLEFRNYDPFLPPFGTYTYYACDSWQSKSLKLYLKKENGERFVRLELTLNRRLLKKHGLNVLPDLQHAHDLNLSQFFCFKMMDIEKWLKCLTKNTYRNCAEERRNKSDNSLQYLKIEQDLIEGGAREHVRCLTMFYPSVMAQVELLRELEAPWYRFLVDL